MAPQPWFAQEVHAVYAPPETRAHLNHKPTVAEVAMRIRGRVGWTVIEGERDLEFLDAFYTAQRRKLEGDLLFGRRRRHKHDRR